MLLSTGFLRVFDTPWLLRDTPVLEGEDPHLAVHMSHELSSLTVPLCRGAGQMSPELRLPPDSVGRPGSGRGVSLICSPQLCRLLPWSLHREPELASWWNRVAGLTSPSCLKQYA